AFHAAAGLPNPALVECVLINPQTFYWKPGMSLDVGTAARAEFFHQFFGAALRPRTWWKILSGQSKLSFPRAVKLLFRSWRARWRKLIAARPDGDEAAVSLELSHPRR